MTPHRAVADELWAAARQRLPVPHISVRHPEFTLDDAYAVQRGVRDAELTDGARLVGSKIGATSEAIQKMFNIDHPDFGFLTDRMLLPDGIHLDTGRFIHPKVEGEIAFELGKDLTGAEVTAQDVLDATSAVIPVLEVLDSRFDSWDITLVDTVADNASSAMAVLGTPVPLGDLDLAAQRMVFEEREGDGTVRSRLTATGAAVMGHPAESVACLIRILASYGDGVRAGDIVLAGSWAGAVDLVPGREVRASFGVLGSVSLVAVGPERTSRGS
ncbi:2-keto-4-pentenoate hydratase [Micromonospora parathelypteridis]|uniref:2-keto-4-pentenoate hydratase n=1 Tax=Micromonospora parathelypteridis TaxID=1839617 RepID=A0A840VU13_9ACTN|nr:fumarylacetoacetate hydrolase family protein [Micromonospora parathelypteridis]MBB5480783.1 2-keto-4-pentenoate hydratase [Micromonospora parathelypteridis]